MASQSGVAFFSLTQAEYAAGSFRSQVSIVAFVCVCLMTILSFMKVLESNMSASVRVTSRTDNVAGVKLPVFGQYETGAAESNENLGLI
jgi:V-type H+-transporting ATPase subunit D